MPGHGGGTSVLTDGLSHLTDGASSTVLEQVSFSWSPALRLFQAGDQLNKHFN